MLIHKRIKDISNDEDYSISQINFFTVWIRRYEIFLIIGREASITLVLYLILIIDNMDTD